VDYLQCPPNIVKLEVGIISVSYLPNIVASVSNAAARWPLESDDSFPQSGFAAAGLSDERDNIAFIDIEIDSVDGLNNIRF
jgi:hypothetical protein